VFHQLLTLPQGEAVIRNITDCEVGSLEDAMALVRKGDGVLLCGKR
jgi:hypothetical protein